MPATSIKITKDETEHRLMFITDQLTGGLRVSIYACDEEFVPLNKPHVVELEGDEEDYHKKLRKDSHEKGHFVAGHSTNPEWSPDYVPHIDENYTC